MAARGKSRRKAVFAFLGKGSHVADPKILRTRVYVDGYNFYYGCLKRTNFKWLDLKSLFDSVLKTVFLEIDGLSAQFELQTPAIKLFTAPILKNFARTPDSVKCQVDYHAALQSHLGDLIKIVEGSYDAKPARAHEYVKGKAAAECNMYDIWKLEEKQSDVALALHAYGDAIRGKIDHAVFATNDTDLVPAMQAIKEHTDVTVGLVIPTKGKERRANTSLEEQSDWIRRSIRAEELGTAQLPTSIRVSSRKLVHKPISWYPRPDNLQPVFEEARRVKKSTSAAWKWLNTPNEDYLSGRRPVDMTGNDEEAAELQAYMRKYAEEHDL